MSEVPSTASSLWYVDDPDPAAVLREYPDPDPEAALALAKQLNPDSDVVPAASGTLKVWAGPNPRSVYIGCFPGVTVVCTGQAMLTRPTTLPELLVRPLASEHTYLISYDIPRGWGAFAHWERGEFRRAFSATRVDILEDEGLPLVWERPYWAGEHPVQLQPGELPDPQILPFDPPSFADEANLEWLGFRYRGATSDDALRPIDVPVCGFSLYPKGEAPPPLRPEQPKIPEHNERRWFGWLRGRDRVS
ncbi:hypothetical protein IU500_09535 [Nocardia terpenica]|nr:hypothetical protein [Nocardia terpenica]MBF6104282.1 hypothetical protein [Nocardia terpenica]MBF6109862.1 hypothetical protein [Nocardia terpenica]MBF6120168.1 hypothetical protein [Nocardia terpenica]MBF6152579.1 hypothetical protein [Nocardia terpenica]